MSWLARGAATVGVAVGTLLTARRGLSQFDNNPDPLGGQVPSFPTSIVRAVTTDDGASINTLTTSAGTAAGNATDAAAEDEPLVVLVHGLTSSHDDWGPIAHRLVSAGIQVMAIDQRGHGNSTVGDDGYGVPRLGADLAHVFETLDLSNVILVGHSMGGMAAMTFLIDHPDVAAARVRSLVLVATTATMSDRRYQAGLRLGALDIPVDIADVNNATLLGASAVFGHAPSRFMLESALASVARCPEEVRLQSTRALVDYDITDGLAEMAVPTLVVAGTRDLLTPFTENEDLAQAIPGARLLRMPGAGHQIIWEENEHLARLIVDLTVPASSAPTTIASTPTGAH